MFADRHVICNETRVHGSGSVDVDGTLDIVSTDQRTRLVEVLLRAVARVAMQVDHRRPHEKSGNEDALLQRACKRNRPLRKREAGIPITGA